MRTDEEGMDEALERARAAPKTGESLEDVLAKLENFEVTERGTPEKVMELPEMDFSGNEESPKIATAQPPPEEPWARIQHELRENQTRIPPESPLVEKMKQVGWEPPPAPPPEGKRDDWSTLQEKLAAAETAPPPAPPPAIAAPAAGPDWASIQKEIQAAERSAETRKTIAAMLHAAAPGFQAPSNIGEGDVAAARLPIEIEKHRRETEAAERGRNAKLLEDSRAAALNDPSSPESKRAQEQYAQRFGDDPRLVPAGLNKMSASEIEKLTSSSVALHGQGITKAKVDTDAEAKARAAADKKTRDDDASAAEKKSLEDEKALLVADPRAKKLGLTPEMVANLDRKGVNAFRAQLDSIRQDKPAGPPKAPVNIEPGKIETVPERRAGYRKLVEGIADGRLEAPKPGGRFGAEIVSDVLAYKPDFDATRFGNYAAVGKQQATAKDVVAMDVGRHHIAIARSLLPDTADTQYINKAAQAFAQKTGDPAFTAFKTAGEVTAHEIASILKIDDQAGKQMVEHMLEPVQSRAQLLAVFDTIDKLIEGKQEGLAAQLMRTAPESVRKKWEAAHGKGGHGAPGKSEPLKQRKTRAGETAYQGRTSGRWFTTTEEAEAN